MRDRMIERRNKVRLMEFFSKVLTKESSQFFIITYKDLFKAYPSPKEIEKGILKVNVKDNIDNVSFFENLIRLGYEVSLDSYVEKGQYYRHGDTLTIWPVNSTAPVRVEMSFDDIERISIFDQRLKEDLSELRSLLIYPIDVPDGDTPLLSFFGRGDMVLDDEVEFPDKEADEFEQVMQERNPESRYMEFRSFMEETPYHHHLHYLSVLKYYNPLDFVSDIR